MTKFIDLIFNPNALGNGFQAVHTFHNDYKISVVCGATFNCHPKMGLTSSDIYSSYEVTVVNSEGLPITDDMFGGYSDSVGWCDRDDINTMMESINKLESHPFTYRYTLVPFPDVQEYMNEEWFDTEAVLCTPQEKNHTLSDEKSAYFIPNEYL